VGLVQLLAHGRSGTDEIFLPFFVVFYLLQGILGGVYLFLSLKLLAAYKKHTRGNYSNLARINLKWLTNITVLQLLLWATSVLAVVRQIVSPPPPGSSDIILEIFYLGMTAVILFAGYYVYRYPEAFQRHVPLETTPQPVEEEKSAMQENLDKAQYKHLLAVMSNQKSYTEPDLTLKGLAGQTKIPAYLLSRLINQYSGNNFFNFINRYRVEEVKKQLSDGGNQDLGLLDIAMDCGFSSKTTFNTIFKKATGMTPSQYRARG